MFLGVIALRRFISSFSLGGHQHPNSSPLRPFCSALSRISRASIFDPLSFFRIVQSRHLARGLIIHVQPLGIMKHALPLIPSQPDINFESELVPPDGRQFAAKPSSLYLIKGAGREPQVSMEQEWVD